MKASKKQLSTKDWQILQKRSLYGKEIKSLAYVIGTMNMILHGIEAPNIVHTNTLLQNVTDIQEKDRFDVILANPPFGAAVLRQVQQNFPIKTGETAYLFLQHFIKSLKAGGRAGKVRVQPFLVESLVCRIEVAKRTVMIRADADRVADFVCATIREPVKVMHLERLAHSCGMGSEQQLACCNWA